MRLRFEHGVPALFNEPEEALRKPRLLRKMLSRFYASDCSGTFFEDLSARELADFIALAWVGCELYAPHEWPDARFEAYAAVSDRMAKRLVQNPALEHWLEKGLAQLEAPRLN